LAIVPACWSLPGFPHTHSSKAWDWLTGKNTGLASRLLNGLLSGYPLVNEASVAAPL
jgi:hypothetical protein